MIRDDYAGVGWSEGLALLGMTDIGIEWDPDACATRAACGHRTIRADLATYRPAGTPDGYIASPPCQTFSTAGNGNGRAELDRIIAAVHAEDWAVADLLDDRTRHVIDAARVAITCGARWVTMEQVPAVLPVWKAVGHDLARYGLSWWAGIVCAADYGVPQTRRRAVLIASKDRTVGRPRPTHAENPTPDLFGPGLERWVSWGEALGWGIPNRPAFTFCASSDQGGPDLAGGSGARAAIRQAQREGRWIPDPSLVIDRRTNSAGARGTVVPTVDVPADRPSPTLTGQTGNQWLMKPATTIAADPRMTARCHHEAGSQGTDARTVEQVAAGDYDGTQPIRLTVDQAACLQSFRPDLPWQGTKSARFRQIGNAVPPLMAAHIIAEATGVSVPELTTPRLEWSAA